MNARTGRYSDQWMQSRRSTCVARYHILAGTSTLEGLQVVLGMSARSRKHTIIGALLQIFRLWRRLWKQSDEQPCDRSLPQPHHTYATEFDWNSRNNNSKQQRYWTMLKLQVELQRYRFLRQLLATRLQQGQRCDWIRTCHTDTIKHWMKLAATLSHATHGQLRHIHTRSVQHTALTPSMMLW